MVTILKSEVRQAREGMGARPRFSERAGDPEFWTWELVRDALVEVADLWRRSPGMGGSPFATDGPWHLMERDSQAGDYDARGGEGKSSDVPLRPLPLGCEEVDRRDRVSGWLGFIAEPRDRKLVVLAVGQLAAGRRNISWRRIRERFGIARGEFGLRKRYEKAITQIVEALNGAEIRR